MNILPDSRKELASKLAPRTPRARLAAPLAIAGALALGQVIWLGACRRSTGAEPPAITIDQECAATAMNAGKTTTPAFIRWIKDARLDVHGAVLASRLVQAEQDRYRNVVDVVDKIRKAVAETGVPLTRLSVDLASDEPSIADVDQKQQDLAVDQHFKLVKLADQLGCKQVSIPLRSSRGVYAQQRDAAAKGLIKLWDKMVGGFELQLMNDVSVIPTEGKNLIIVAAVKNRFDLQLMSWGDGSGVPTSGNNLVIVGIDSNGLLHIRIYDAAGNRITVTDEAKLPAAQAAAIAILKQQLPGLLPPHVLTDAEKVQVIGEATSIVGQTYVLHFRIFDGDGKKVVDTDETKLTEKARQIGDLRKQLPGLLPPHVPTDAEKAQVIGEATSIVGYPAIEILVRNESGLSSNGVWLADVLKAVLCARQDCKGKVGVLLDVAKLDYNPRSAFNELVFAVSCTPKPGEKDGAKPDEKTPTCYVHAIVFEARDPLPARGLRASPRSPASTTWTGTTSARRASPAISRSGIWVPRRARGSRTRSSSSRTAPPKAGASVPWPQKI